MVTAVPTDRSEFGQVLASAARLQELVPNAVVVGGSAAALHAGHRLSSDHDHVVADLADRFDTVLENLEALDDWSTARVRPGKLILGSLGGIETGIRQLRRSRPLEVVIVEIEDKPLRVPTPEETLRIKAWLALTRNQTRDYLDIAALSDAIGIDRAASVLSEIDEYYRDLYKGDDRAASQLVRQLGRPRPRDTEVTKELSSYKQLAPRWHDWDTVAEVLASVARRMVEQ
jgi:hypothetical protein